MTDKLFIFMVYFGTFVLLSLGCFVVYENIRLKTTEKQYCGLVVERFIIPPEYKKSSTAHLVFYNNNLNKNIHVVVNMNTYVNSPTGKNVCFVLNDQEID